MARRLARIAALTSAFIPSLSAALGVGPIATESSLNQPLEARIPLESADAQEVESLRAALASPETFQRAGLERPFMLSRLQFEVVTEAVPEPYVAIRTSDPVREPFLAFLVELNWSGGRLIREYTVLLDPPLHAREEKTVPTAADGRDAGDLAREREASARTTPEDAGYFDALTEGRVPREVEVARNDTLWEVADEVRPDDAVSVHQMMMALWEANPAAFANGNVNNLRAGAVLRVPDREQATSRSARDARREFAAHMDAWRAGRALDPAPEDDPQLAEVDAEPEINSARLEVVAAGETSGDDATASLMDDDLAATAENVSRLQAELAAQREEKASLRSENEDLQQQIGELLGRVEALERTIDIQVTDAIPGMTEEPLAVDSSLAEAPSEEQAAPQDDAPVDADLAVDEPAATQLQAPWDDTRLMGLGGAGITALLVLLLLMVRRRRAGVMDAAATGIAVPVPAAADGEGNTGQAPARAAPTESKANEVEGAPARGGNGDPLEEIDVYLAYGHYDQARELLATAVTAAPERKDLRLKQLEVYGHTNARAAFEAGAQELYTLVDGEHDPVWKQVVDMGRAIAPDNPLFAADGAGATAAPTTELTEAAGSTLTTPEPEPPLDIELDEQGDEPVAPVQERDEDDFSDLEFSLDEVPEPSSAEQPLETPGQDREAAPAALESEPADGDAFSLDFDLDDLGAPDSESSSARDESSEPPQPTETLPPAEATDAPGADELSLDFESWEGSEPAAPSVPEVGAGANAADEDGDGDAGLAWHLDHSHGGADTAAADAGLSDALPSHAGDPDSRDDGSSEGGIPPSDLGEDEALSLEIDEAIRAASGDEPSSEDDNDDLFDTGDETSTKLDLARAYLDMGDSEGARALLDEVLQEGSEQHKTEARSLYEQAR